MKIFLSSSFRDLIRERKAVLEALQRRQQSFAAMEYFLATPKTPLAICLDELRKSDIVLVVVGLRSGSLLPDGLNSGARYTSQHYNPKSAGSNLARSILLNPERAEATGVDASTVGPWIKENTDRVNLLAPASFGLPMLSLLEAFLHVRWKPIFEGAGGDL